MADYLTEAKLYGILCDWVGQQNVTQQVPMDGSRLRFDYVVRFNGQDIVVEFDGDSHYCNPSVIERDNRKAEFCKTKNLKFVRIPYFVQLTPDTFKFYFGVVGPQLTTTFPHGFITTKVLPSYFCFDGVERFYSELKLMDSAEQEIKKVAYEIRKSIQNYKGPFRKHGRPDGYDSMKIGEQLFSTK